MIADVPRFRPAKRRDGRVGLANLYFLLKLFERPSALPELLSHPVARILELVFEDHR